MTLFIVFLTMVRLNHNLDEIEKKNSLNFSSTLTWLNLFRRTFSRFHKVIDVFKPGTNCWHLFLLTVGEYNHQTKSFLAVQGSTAANGDEAKKKKFSTNPLENMDCKFFSLLKWFSKLFGNKRTLTETFSISDQSQEFKDGVARLSQLLHVPHHADHLITLEACCKLIQKRLNAKSLKDPSKVVGTVRSRSNPIILKLTDRTFEIITLPWYSRLYRTKGPSINDFTVLEGGGGQLFCGDSTKTLVLKTVRMGEGCLNLSKNAWHHLWTTPKAINRLMAIHHKRDKKILQQFYRT